MAKIGGFEHGQLLKNRELNESKLICKESLLTKEYITVTKIANKVLSTQGAAATNLQHIWCSLSQRLRHYQQAETKEGSINR